MYLFFSTQTISFQIPEETSSRYKYDLYAIQLPCVVTLHMVNADIISCLRGHCKKKSSVELGLV